MKHPSERGGDERSLFDRVAERASNFSSSPAFFVGCAGLMLAWLTSYAAGLGADAHHLLAESMAAVTLLLLALLKNAELRAEHAIQEKLDAIAAALLEQRHGDSDEAARELEYAIGLHEET